MHTRIIVMHARMHACADICMHVHVRAVNAEADEKDRVGRVAAVCKEITALTLLQLLALPSDHVSAYIMFCLCVCV